MWKLRFLIVVEAFLVLYGLGGLLLAAWRSDVLAAGSALLCLGYGRWALGQDLPKLREARSGGGPS